MNTPGLSQRLNQRSRRAGLAIGLSMAATIAVCIGTFSIIYAAIEPVARDFAGANQSHPTATVHAGASTVEDPDAAPTEKPAKRETRTPSAASGEPTEVVVPTAAVFRVTHRTNTNVSVNLRPEPGTDNVPVAVLSPGTPLQFLDERQVGTDGFQWLKVRTENGREGWIREGTIFEQ